MTTQKQKTITQKNPNCDGEHCNAFTGEVRLLPVGGQGNAILCRACFDFEMKYRRALRLEAGSDFALPVVKWDALKIYSVK